MLVAVEEARRALELALVATAARLRENALGTEPGSATSGLKELQPPQSRAYVREQMVAAEINWDTLAGRFIEARTRRGLTRRQLAKLAGTSSETTLRYYEQSRILEPREDIVFEYARALGCSAVWLLYGRGDPEWVLDWKHPKFG